MVPQLLALKDLVDRVAHECFQRNERFLLSTKESFEFFINERPNKPAEMLGIARDPSHFLAHTRTVLIGALRSHVRHCLRFYQFASAQ